MLKQIRLILNKCSVLSILWVLVFSVSACKTTTSKEFAGSLYNDPKDELRLAEAKGSFIDYCKKNMDTCLQTDPPISSTCALSGMSYRLECIGKFSDLTTPSPEEVADKPSTWKTKLAPFLHGYSAISTSDTTACWIKYGVMECASSSPGFDKLSFGSARFSAVSVSTRHGCALRQGDGKAICWGNGTFGRLGVGMSSKEYDDRFEAPSEVVGDHKFKSIAVSILSTCALKENGELYCWGYGGSGQLANGRTNPPPPPPTKPEDIVMEATPKLVEGHKFVSISGGIDHFCGLKEAGDAFCWGNGKFGKLGDGDTSDHRQGTITAVKGDHKFVSISAGDEHTCAIDKEGRAFCWGSAEDGRLGNGKFHPHQIALPQEVIFENKSQKVKFFAISAGLQRTCALAETGDVYCWGRSWEYGGDEYPTKEERMKNIFEL